MSKYYLDFVGLNTFIYEPCGFEGEQASEFMSSGDTRYNQSNHFGTFMDGGGNDTTSIAKYKNHWFSHNLPNRTSGWMATASFFPALMLHRNGPYGWPSWKSMRLGQNPLIRKQRKNNFISVVKNGAARTYWLNGQQYTVFDRYGSLKLYDEPCVVSNKPINIKVATVVGNTPSSFGQEVPLTARFNLDISFNNETSLFCNSEINDILSIVENNRSQDYENKTGKKVACIEEIALKLGYIDKTELMSIANSMKNSNYGNYLLKTIRK